MAWDQRLRVNGYDVTEKMPLTMAVLKEQERTMEQVQYDDGVTRPAHSVKGASSAERWMNCPGSSALIAEFGVEETTDEPSYRAEGTAMHEAAAQLLAEGRDAWEIVGDTYHGIVLTEKMCDAIQMYLDRVRENWEASEFHGEKPFIEARLAAPQVHEQMFGSVDFALLTKVNDTARYPKTSLGGFLDVTDLKGGEGLTVEPEDNPQMKYYAYMLIVTKFSDLDDDFPVRLTIVQPRAFHQDGPIRDWWTTVGEIKAWVVRDLLPAMHSTDDSLESGKWCRFCPAKLVCPLLGSLFRAAATYDPKAIAELQSETLGKSYEQVAAVKFYLKALEDEVFKRNSAGKTVPGTKLVHKRADRIFKETAYETVEGGKVAVPLIDAAKHLFGKDAFTTPELKSPPQIEALGPKGKEFVKEYAYMPVTGLTVAPEKDKRHAVSIQSASERFAGALENIAKEGDTE